MSVRLYHRGSRLVLVQRRYEGDTSEHRWIALHIQPAPWSQIFDRALQILEMSDDPAIDLGWTAQPYWTTIHLRLTEGSLRKRQLVAAALLKAARYQVL